ncbi:MAG: hypothetical protein RIC80_09970 [Cyclobacteriaceae bacterium]
MNLTRPLLNLMTVLTGLITLIACDNDDDTPPAPSIEGIVWTQVSYEYTDCDFEDSNGGESLKCNEQNCRNVLFESGISIYTEVENGVTSTFQVPYTLSEDDRFSAGGLSATYQIEGDTLTIQSFDAGDGCTLVEVYTRS